MGLPTDAEASQDVKASNNPNNKKKATLFINLRTCDNVKSAEMWRKLFDSEYLS